MGDGQVKQKPYAEGSIQGDDLNTFGAGFVRAPEGLAIRRGEYKVSEGEGDKKVVTARILVDADRFLTNGYVVVKVQAAYTEIGDRYVFVPNSFRFKTELATKGKGYNGDHLDLFRSYRAEFTGGRLRREKLAVLRKALMGLVPGVPPVRGSIDPSTISALDPDPYVLVTFDSNVPGTVRGFLKKKGSEPIAVNLIPQKHGVGENVARLDLKGHKLTGGKYNLELEIVDDQSKVLQRLSAGYLRVRDGADALKVEGFTLPELVQPEGPLPLEANTTLADTQVTLRFTQQGAVAGPVVRTSINPGQGQVTSIKVPDSLQEGEYVVVATFEAGGMKWFESRPIKVAPNVLGILDRQHLQGSVLPSFKGMRLIGVKVELDEAQAAKEKGQDVQIVVEGVAYKTKGGNIVYEGGKAVTVGETFTGDPIPVTLKSLEWNEEEVILTCGKLLERGKKSTVGLYRVTVRRAGKKEGEWEVLRTEYTEVLPAAAMPGPGRRTARKR